jgi:hypothetical protein
MLYTVMPLERIYSNRAQSILGNGTGEEEVKSSEAAEYRTISLAHGSVYARRKGDKYVVDGIHSTDMSDYLNPSYFPGSSIDV